MVKRYTSWDVVTDVGENIFVLEADYATLLAERDRLKGALEEIAKERTWEGVDPYKEMVPTGGAEIARKAMEGRDGQ